MCNGGSITVVARLCQAEPADRDDPVAFRRMVRTGRRGVATLTDDDLAPSPFPHFRHRSPAPAGAQSRCSATPRTDATDARSGNQSGAAGHDGVAQGAVGSENDDGDIARPALVRKDPPAQGQGGVLGDHSAGVSQRGRAPTGGADLRPRHDVGVDDVPRLGQSPGISAEISHGPLCRGALMPPTAKVPPAGAARVVEWLRHHLYRLPAAGARAGGDDGDDHRDLDISGRHGGR